MKNFIIQMGQMARQFVLEHGSTNGFMEHVLNNTNTFDGASSFFSPEDLATINL